MRQVSVQSLTRSCPVVKPVQTLAIPSFQSTLCFDIEILRKLADSTVARIERKSQLIVEQEEEYVNSLQLPKATNELQGRLHADVPVLCSFSKVPCVRICNGNGEQQCSMDNAPGRSQLMLVHCSFSECHAALSKQTLPASKFNQCLFEMLERMRKSVVDTAFGTAILSQKQVFEDMQFNRLNCNEKENGTENVFTFDRIARATHAMSCPILTILLSRKSTVPSINMVDNRVWPSFLSLPGCRAPLLKVRSFIHMNRRLPLKFWSQESLDMVRKSRWNMSRSFLLTVKPVRTQLLDLSKSNSTGVEHSPWTSCNHSVFQKNMFHLIKTHWRGSRSKRFLRYYLERKIPIMTEFERNLAKQKRKTSFTSKIRHNLSEVQDTKMYFNWSYDSAICVRNRYTDQDIPVFQTEDNDGEHVPGKNWRSLANHFSTDGQIECVLDEFHPDDNTDNGMDDIQEGELTTSERNAFVGDDGVGRAQETIGAIQLAVPECMTCSAWSIQAATSGLESQKAVWFVPPLLSILPTLAIMANSHLAMINRDYRVAVVCIGDDRDVKHTYNMFKSCLNNSISIDIASQKPIAAESTRNVGELSESQKGVRNEQVTGRVVIQKNFSSVLASGFSLLLIVISAPTLTGLQSERHCSIDLTIPDLAQWKNIPSIAIAPANIWTGVQAYTRIAERVATQLDVSKAIYIAENSDVAYALDASQPGVDIVRAGRDACLLCEIIDREGREYLDAYNMVVEREGQKVGTTILRETKEDCLVQKAGSVRAVNVLFLKTFLGQLEYWDDECEKVARIFDLRQTRSYALHDGFYTAVEYAQQCAEMNPSRGELWEKLLRAAQLIKPSIFRNIPNLPTRLKPIPDGRRREYRMRCVVQQCLWYAQTAMSEESSVVRRVHGREKFSPVIITDSSEAFSRLKEDGLFLDLFNKHDGTNETTVRSKKRVVPVFHRDDIRQTDGSGVEEILTEFVRRVDDYSHVLYVTDDRNSGVPDHALPAKLLQLASAGRTNLTRIIVDENGAISYKWDREKMIYKRINLVLVATAREAVRGCAEYIVTSTLERILERTVIQDGQNDTDDVMIGSVDTQNGKCVMIPGNSTV